MLTRPSTPSRPVHTETISIPRGIFRSSWQNIAYTSSKHCLINARYPFCSLVDCNGFHQHSSFKQTFSIKWSHDCFKSEPFTAKIFCRDRYDFSFNFDFVLKLSKLKWENYLSKFSTKNTCENAKFEGRRDLETMCYLSLCIDLLQRLWNLVVLGS